MVQAFSDELLKKHFPSQRETDDGVFEIALACCGGTSTGAYVAGVLDFIWEAFECWRAAAAQGKAPNHKVLIRNLAGTSAGGLSLGLAALASLKQFPHVYDPRLWETYAPGQPQPKTDNPHYRAWVEEITLDRLLSHPEEVETGQIYLFHSAPSEICRTVLDMVDRAPAAARRDWLYDPLELRATIGNLDGVPYALDFNNVVGGKLRLTTQYFRAHRDNVAFAVRTGAVGGTDDHRLGPAPDAHELSLANFQVPPPGGRAREMFQAAMVATSAIPLVFKVTSIPQSPQVYDWRGAYWDLELKKAVYDRPVWRQPPKDPLDYPATDGGLFDNKPFTLAHQRLAGARGRNPQTAMTACRAVILVDPLADEREPPPPNPQNDQVLEMITKMVFAPITQSRLDTLDLAQIKSDDVFSRFMIAPSREHPAKPKVYWGPSKALLSAPFAAFLGFAAHAYREHDFLLGRRNAQRFLSQHFMLPVGHRLFKGQTGWLKRDMAREDGVDYYPVVPLRGRAADEQPQPAWTWTALTDRDIDRYVELARDRADAIFHNLRSGVDGTLARLYLSLGWSNGGRRKVLDAFRDGLELGRASLDPARADRNL